MFNPNSTQPAFFGKTFGGGFPPSEALNILKGKKKKMIKKKIHMEPAAMSQQ
jgi:hypothetical protein